MSRVRAATHVHSAWSYDAEWPLHELARAFRKRGYAVVLMAEHDRGFTERRWIEYQQACAEASSDDILLVPGIEYEDADNVVHVPIWGTSMPFLGSGRATLDTLRAANEHGACAVLAHPWRRGAISRFEPEWARFLSGIEIWNRQYDGVAPHRGARVIAEREALAPFVSLDFHTARQFFPLAMTLTINGTPTPESVVEAINERACVPEFFGVRAVQFTHGPAGALVRSLEAGRRKVRRPVRWLQHRAVAATR